MEGNTLKRMTSSCKAVIRTTWAGAVMVLLQAGNSVAMTVPAAGSFAYDLYDIGVNQILLGPVGFTGGVACMCVAAILAIRQMILPAAGVVLGGAFLLRANTVVETIGALIC
jgi:hypothetical protein